MPPPRRPGPPPRPTSPHALVPAPAPTPASTRRAPPHRVTPGPRPTARPRPHAAGAPTPPAQACLSNTCTNCRTTPRHKNVHRRRCAPRPGVALGLRLQHDAALVVVDPLGELTSRERPRSAVAPSRNGVVGERGGLQQVNPLLGPAGSSVWRVDPVAVSVRSPAGCCLYDRSGLGAVHVSHVVPVRAVHRQDSDGGEIARHRREGGRRLATTISACLSVAHTPTYVHCRAPAPVKGPSHARSCPCPGSIVLDRAYAVAERGDESCRREAEWIASRESSSRRHRASCTR
jgi:hypothetical protein